MPHSVSNHPEFPLEKWKALNPKNKLIMNTVRDTILVILQWEDIVLLKRYTEKIDWENAPKKLWKKEIFALDIWGIQEEIWISRSSPQVKAGVKKWTHMALEEVGIHAKNTDKRIRTAIETLGWQYRIMSGERFVHRLDNGKVERDARFLIGMMRYMSQLGKEWLISVLDVLFSDGNYPALDKSDSMKALRYLIKKWKETLKHNSKDGSYKEFKDLLISIAGEVGDK